MNRSAKGNEGDGIYGEGGGIGWGGRELVTKKFSPAFGRRLLVSKVFDQQH